MLDYRAGSRGPPAQRPARTASTIAGPPGQRPRHRRRGVADGRREQPVASASTPATRRSTATTISSTRSSSRRARTWRSPASISRISRRAGRCRSTSRRAGKRVAQRRRGRARESERGPHPRALRRDATDLDLPVRVRRRADSRSSTAERNGRTFRMFHRETDAAKVARNRDAIFDLHAAALAWLERYTEIPYPFGKFDFVLVPAFQFGGMEHPGAIFYNAVGPDARRDRDAGSDARPRQRHRARDERTCGSAIWSRCAGSRTCG